MSNQKTLKALPNATSSPGSADGASPHESQDGQKIDHSGRALAPANRSRSRAKAKVLTTFGICGPTSFASSVPAGPLSSWESRLRERLAMVGSTELALIWREKVTPAGRSMSRLAPWTPPISEAGCGGLQRQTWGTPLAQQANGEPEAFLQRKRDSIARGNSMGVSLSDLAMQMKEFAPSSWSTPRASDGEKGGPNQSFGAGGQPLPAQMHQATWPTPTARDHFPPHTPEYIAKHKANGHGMSNLNDAMALWPTPIAAADKYRLQGDSQQSKALYPALIHTAEMDRSGQEPDGSPATTEKRGAPNPAFPCWLMGYPAVWLLGAVSATQSSRKSRRK
jgi:hypothetical protein